jgi:catechol 2,3-dioxygenase-like lactoylglutathione lyase family enzyme
MSLRGSALMADLSLDHLALPVYDAAATYHFYAEILGLPLVAALEGDNWGGYPWLMMFFGAGQQLLALCALRGAQPPAPSRLPEDVCHYAFAVKSAAEQRGWVTRLRAHGIDCWEEDHGAQHSVYFRDPNGIVLEVTTPPSNGDADAPAAHAAVRRWLQAAGTSRPDA